MYNRYIYIYIYIIYIYTSVIFYYFRQYLNEEPCKWMCQIKLINNNNNNNNNRLEMLLFETT